eukprot:865410-Rhodomonas_salina.2
MPGTELAHRGVTALVFDLIFDLRRQAVGPGQSVCMRRACVILKWAPCCIFGSEMGSEYGMPSTGWLWGYQEQCQLIGTVAAIYDCVLPHLTDPPKHLIQYLQQVPCPLPSYVASGTDLSSLLLSCAASGTDLHSPMQCPVLLYPAPNPPTHTLPSTDAGCYQDLPKLVRFAPNMQVDSAICLGACYAMPGTDIAYQLLTISIKCLCTLVQVCYPPTRVLCDTLY